MTLILALAFLGLAALAVLVPLSFRHDWALAVLCADVLAMMVLFGAALSAVPAMG